MRFLLLFFLVCLQTACAKDYPVKLGEETVVIRVNKQGAGKTFIHLHHNETTALAAAKALIAQQGGSCLTLLHPGGRNIVFHQDHQRFEFDPNRIFTDTGIRKTLSEFGPYNKKAHAEVRKLADLILQLLPPGKVIAVHNNESYSLKDYLPGHPLALDAKSLHVNKEQYFRNFYLVTKKEDYLRFKHLDFNSILQGEATDDGSLSVYLSGREYINVEAGYDQLAAQISMLKYA